MVKFFDRFAIFALSSAFLASASPKVDERAFAPQDIITRDVLIIGGGATGTYAAVRLREDFKKTVVIVEQSSRIGGHTETYTDPITHFPVDYGVQAWHNISVVTSFFARLGVSLTSVPSSSPFATKYVDFKTGKAISGYMPQDPAAALGILAAELQKYPYLVTGFNLPDPVPSDLLLPFEKYVKKYGIEAAVPIIWTFAHGVGDLLNTPTLYIFRNFGLPQLQDLFGGSFLTTTNHFNSELYLKASALLGTDVSYNTTLVDVKRNDNGVHQITVQTPTGRKLIKTKKILVTIPPTLENLKSFSLDHTENDIFKQWLYTTYFTGIIRNGIPDGMSVSNFAQHSTYNIPRPPYIRDFSFSGIPGLHTFSTVSLEPQSSERISTIINSQIASMLKEKTFPASSMSIEVLSNHSPLQLHVCTDAIKKGFYRDLYALQGRHGTFYTGAAFAQDDSSLLWAFTEGVLPKLVAVL